ncbi:MAG: phytoene desaturase family protein [Myxococcota bacterium]
MAAHDVIVIGAGHNGLVAAATLARAGRNVLLLESRHQVGGAAVTEEPWPGFRVSTCAGGAGYLAPEISRDLKLAEHGLEFLPSEVVAFCPKPDGSALTLWRDPQRAAAEIGSISAADAESYPRFVELMGKIAGVVGGLARATPPALPHLGWQDLATLPKLAGPVRRLGRKNVNELLRVLPMSVADLLNEWFESDAVKGALAAGGVRDITWGPKEAGTAYVLLYYWALSNSGNFRSAGQVKGGMGALTSALAASARSLGAEIRTESPVARVELTQGRATGVLLESGEKLAANVVLSSAPPRTTFVELLEPRLLSATLVKHVGNIKYRGSAARLHLALSGLPEFTAAGTDGEERLRGAIQIAPSVNYLQRAYECTKYGEFSPRPFLDIRIPTLADPDLAPAGQHLMSITVKYAPYALGEGSWQERGEALAEATLDTLAEYAPKIRDQILQQQVLTPADLEATFGLPEGNGNHGEMTLDQFFHMRPIPGHARYSTPVDGLYLCGAGSHPGGGVTGIPGLNAAREVLKGGK